MMPHALRAPSRCAAPLSLTADSLSHPSTLLHPAGVCLAPPSEAHLLARCHILWPFPTATLCSSPHFVRSQGALHVRTVAALYGVPVILHTDHCQRSWLPWFDGLMDANEDYFAKNGEPLFSSHMLDLSEEPLEENIATCVEYLERMSKSNILLEMELGVTGGEEDGVDNSDVDSSKLYTQPDEVYEVYKALKAVEGGMFTVAAAFGNVHGVYAPGNVELTPDILHNTQKYISEQEGLPEGSKPVSFVFHGGSGSSREDIRYAIEAGTIKMNIDTDTQW